MGAAAAPATPQLRGARYAAVHTDRRIQGGPTPRSPSLYTFTFEYELLAERELRPFILQSQSHQPTRVSRIPERHGTVAWDPHGGDPRCHLRSVLTTVTATSMRPPDFDTAMEVAGAPQGSTVAKSLTLEDRRRSIHACLLRYSPEAGLLRDRAMDRLVLSGLLGSSEADPFRMGAIQGNLQTEPRAAHIRQELIQDALNRLMAAGKVRETAKRGRRAYYLSPETATEIASMIAGASNLIQEVSARTFADIAFAAGMPKLESVFRRFVAAYFAAFGEQIARVVTGRSDGAEGIHPADVSAALSFALDGMKIDPDTRTSLNARFIHFLRSVHPTDQRLKFTLTQGYYFAQLLGGDNKSFDPLTESAFVDSVFYLDTNVLIPHLLRASGTPTQLEELTRISRRIGIELRVTRAMVNEARRVAADRRPQIEQAIGALPSGVIRNSDDDFMMAFLDQRDRHGDSLSCDLFLERFDSIPEFCEREGITFEDRSEDDQTVDELMCRQLSEEALRIRGFGKSETVARHDAFHLSLVHEERARRPKTWFLTRDGTMASVRPSHAPNAPLTFSLVGFLHSISPFLTSPEEERALAGVFSTLTDSLMWAPEGVFDLQELGVLSEMHADVLATPQDQLLRAFDYVKSHVLEGRPFRSHEVPKVALGLRKFLSSSAADQRKALLDEKRRLEVLAMEAEARSQEERTRRESAETRLSDEESARRRSERETADAEDRSRQERQRREAAEKQVAGTEDRARSLDAKLRYERRLKWAGLGIAGVLVAVILWRVAREFPATLGSVGQTALGLVGIFLFSLPVARLTQLFKVAPSLRTGLVAAVVLVAIKLCGVVSDATVNWFADGATGALVLAAAFLGRDDG